MWPHCKAISGFSGGLWPMFLIMNIGHSEMQKEMASMAGSITKGKSKQLKGKAREAFGKLTGKKTQQIKGKTEQAAGKVQEQYGKAERSIKRH